MLGALLLIVIAGTCAGCGSGGRADAGITITDTAAKTPLAKARAAVTPLPSTPAATDCPSATLEALEYVGHNVYEESASGRVVAEAVYRLESSQALAEATARGEASAVKRVLRSLLLNQIVSVQVERAGRTLARIEHGIGIAPASGRLLLDGVLVGTFVVSTQGANGYTQTTSGLTAAQILMRNEDHTLRSTLRLTPSALRALRKDPREVSFAGIDYRVDTFAGRVFPNRPLSISLLVPSSAIATVCASAAARANTDRARANTWGLVAERVYRAEREGSKAQLILGVVERSRAFRDAVLAGNAKATRAAIIGFFRAHLHVVRVRVMRAGHLLVDVGGPHVLAPIHGVIRDARGRVAGRFEMAIQDDLGFTILTHAFTGAQTLMREGAKQVMGTLEPGPTSVPDTGQVTYLGTIYEAYSFDAEAFPSGALRISLLFPTS
ncbi:MAG TPA: hypothetical protein VGL37_04510 [Solirubrobacteraceae bacterium]|jgi:hypothetical protein